MSDLSRVEQLLRNALGEDIYEVTPQSRVEVLLQQLNEYIEGMGGGSVDPEVITAQNTANILKAFPTDTASGAVASFSDGADNIPLKSLIVNIDPVQDTSSGDPSPENICPISGWTECEINATGYNVWDEQWENGRYTGGEKRVNSLMIRSKNYIPVKPNTTYYFNGGVNNGNMWAYFYDRDKVCLNPTGNGAKVGNLAVATPDNCYYFNFYLSEQTEYQHDVAINYPSTDHDYHPYVGQTIPISWQTEAGTVYGGKLDVLSGVMSVTKALVDAGTVAISATIPTKGIFSLGLPNGLAAGTNGKVYDAICDTYKFSTNGYNDAHDDEDGVMWMYPKSSNARVRDSRLIGYSAAEAKAALSGVNIVYPLAEPIEIQLTPNNEVNSLLGQNNIFADTGDCSVEYRADTTLYISRLTEPDADMIADANIVSGQYFMVGNSLFKATANIASGGQVIVGTNATRKSLSEALNEINA